MKYTGIYIIKCLVNNKVLIGESGNIKKRINYHIQNLKGKRHENPHLQNAWNKYGEENFVFQILEYCDFDQCKIRENYYCNIYCSHDPEKGYNIRPTGIELKGKFTEEHKRKLSESLRKSEKFKNRDSGKGMRNKKHSEKTRRKMSKSSIGKTHSEETRLKISRILKGRIRNKSSIIKQINTRLKNNEFWHSMETRRKMSNPRITQRDISKYKYNIMIKQYNEEGNLIKTYNNIDEISKEFNKYKILEVCNNERYSHKKYIWKYGL